VPLGVVARTVDVIQHRRIPEGEAESVGPDARVAKAKRTLDGSGEDSLPLFSDVILAVMHQSCEKFPWEGFTLRWYKQWLRF